jgi:hypothetical protein
MLLLILISKFRYSLTSSTPSILTLNEFPTTSTKALLPSLVRAGMILLKSVFPETVLLPEDIPRTYIIYIVQKCTESLTNQ